MTPLLRSMLVTEEHPWPPRGGIALRNAANAAALAALGPLTLVGVGDDAGDHRPSPLGEIRAVGLGHAPRADPTDEWARRPHGHPSDSRWSEEVGDRWRRLVAATRPDVVVVEQLWLHRFAAAAAEAGATTVLDAHNVEADVYSAIAAATPADQLASTMAERTRLLEAATVHRVGQVWACSRNDRAVFERLAPDVRLVPNAVDTKALRLRTPGLRAPHLVFPASFAYPPNVRAARVLVDVVLPRFAAQVGGARLSLVGRDPPRWMQRVGRDDPAVSVTGPVPSVRPWFERAAALVVPLEEGGGTRFKVLEAMALGVPVVSTAKGVEGLEVRDGEHVLIGADAGELADLAVLAHRADLDELTRSARALVEARYSWEAVVEAVASATDVAPSLFCR